jgi:hypothetical protein
MAGIAACQANIFYSIKAIPSYTNTYTHQVSQMNDILHNTLIPKYCDKILTPENIDDELSSFGSSIVDGFERLWAKKRFMD